MNSKMFDLWFLKAELSYDIRTQFGFVALAPSLVGDLPLLVIQALLIIHYYSFLSNVGIALVFTGCKFLVAALWRIYSFFAYRRDVQMRKHMVELQSRGDIFAEDRPSVQS